LPLQDFRASLLKFKPCGAIEFGKHLTPPGSRRPFYLEHIALEIGGVPVLFDSPYVNDLSSWLLRLAQRHRLTARTVTSFFRKLAFCCGEGSFTRRDQSLWNRPRSQVLLAPEGSTRMTEQDFDATDTQAVEEKPRALFTGYGCCHYHARLRGRLSAVYASDGTETLETIAKATRQRGFPQLVRS
jgi:hypothetical protein